MSEKNRSSIYINKQGKKYLRYLIYETPTIKTWKLTPWDRVDAISKRSAERYCEVVDESEVKSGGESP